MRSRAVRRIRLSGHTGTVSPGEYLAVLGLIPPTSGTTPACLPPKSASSFPARFVRVLLRDEQRNTPCMTGVPRVAGRRVAWP
jgi:hypothetical protein